MKRIFYAEETYLHKPWIDEGPKLRRGDVVTIFGGQYRVQFANLALPSDDFQRLWVYPAAVFFGVPEDERFESEEVLNLLFAIQEEAAEFDADRFADILKGTILADRHYADRNVNDFRNGPFSYLLSRSPLTQSVALLTALLGLREKKAAPPARIDVGTTEGLAAVPTAFALPGRLSDTLRIEATAFDNGKPTKWAVRDSGCVLNTSGEMEYEPMNSHRDEDFFARCRFDAITDAVGAAWKFVNK